MALTAKASATRAALLEAAAEQLGSRGWDATTTTSIAERAGVSTGTFYTYFADKHAVLADLFDRGLAELIAAVDSVLTADNLLDDGLDATISEVVALVVDGYRRNAATIRTALGRVTTDPTLRTIYWRRHAEAMAVVERFLRRGQAAGLVRREDATVLGHTLLLLTQGLNQPVLLAADDPALAAGVQAEVVRLVVSLLAADPTQNGSGALR